MPLKGNRREKQEKEKKEGKKRRKRKPKKRKKKNKFFSLIEKTHKNIWKWKLRSNGGIVGEFKRK